MAEALTGKLASLNPFSRTKKNDDDKGDEIDEGTIGGGGRAAGALDITKHELRVSRAQKEFLVKNEVLSEDDAAVDSPDPSDAVLYLLGQPHAVLPAELTDRSFRLPEYFISSSHNTYLKAHQLFGSSAADAYSIALSTGSRCVEIDAWDGDDDPEEPKVTHGYTLVSNISLRAVCETIRDVVDKEARSEDVRPSPIVISLENHCGAHGQLRIAQIMTEVLGDRLLSEPLPAADPDEHVTLEELGAKVIVMVEHHIPGEKEEESETSDDSSDSSDSDDDDKDKEKKAHEEYKEKKKKEQAGSGVIIPELAAIGVYAQSVKPSNNTWFDPAGGELADRPHHHLINVSESGLAAHLAAPEHRAGIAQHNSRHLMRVYPKGTRISSRNLHPAPFWAVGAQVSALNWQRFDATMQLNEAMFRGSDGYVLKPAALRQGGSFSLKSGRAVKLRLHVAGAAGIPVAQDRDPATVKPYLTCSLVHPDDLGTPPPERKRKTQVYKHTGLKALVTGSESSPQTDPLWDEVLEWEYEDNELVFLRLLVKNDESWSANPKFVVAAVRLSYVQPGWKFIRMLDLKGRETKCSLLVKFDVIKD